MRPHARREHVRVSGYVALIQIVVPADVEYHLAGRPYTQPVIGVAARTLRVAFRENEILVRRV